MGDSVVRFEIVEPDDDRDGPPRFQGMVGDSGPSRDVYEQIKTCAFDLHGHPVLITGDTGTGKELVARAVHNQSSRKKGQCLVVNCNGLNRDLIEPRFFGHSKGAFTGAHAEKAGLLEETKDGTLVLDELGDMAPEVQGVLLLVLEKGTYFPVGSTTPVQATTRFVASTNRDVEKMVADGTFRADLLGRLNYHRILLPPLRDRPDDILPLAFHFLGAIDRRMGLSDEACRRLVLHDWPYNVRDLKAAIVRAAAAAAAAHVDTITPAHMSLPPKSEKEEEARDAAYRPGETLEEVGKKYALSVFEKNGRNIKKTARDLGIGRTTIKRKLRDWGIICDNEDDAPSKDDED